ncbi:hypothetical protein [Alloalcanivorax profundimaris]|uniref:hypothetical protein n=1 Tax=Alloalcanivorax profundimaris TaxID=2735259 RepID=UPI0018911000|nr:hypothetical protein [Alloalcanivorax profundimaris]
MGHRIEKTPWYRVPLLWLGLLILLASVTASVHLIVISLSVPQAHGPAEQGTAFRGVPLHREPGPVREAPNER